MNSNPLEMSSAEGTLLLFEDATSGSYSNSNNGSRASGSARVSYMSRTPLPKYLEEYYSDVMQMERAVSAKCNECGTVVKGSLGVTSNFLRHLRQRHPFIEVQNPGRPYLPTTDHIVTIDYHQPAISTHNTSTPTSVPPPINTSSPLMDIQAFTHPRQRIMTEATLKWLSTDMLPLSIVEESGFQEFCKNMDQSYAKVNRRTLSRMLSGKVGNEILPSMKTTLGQLEDGNLHLTVDVWEKCGSEPGLFAVRGYFANEQWELRHHTLGFTTIENERQETENLLPTCAATLGQYGIDLNKVGTITTGNAWKTLNTTYTRTPSTDESGKETAASTEGEQRSQQQHGEEFLGAAAVAVGETEEQREKHLPGGAEIRICKTEAPSDGYDTEEGHEDPLSAEFECLQTEHLPSVIDALHRVARKAIESSPIAKSIVADLVNNLEYARRNTRWRDELIDHLPRKFRAPLKRNWNSQIDLLQWFSEDEVYATLTTCLSSAWNEQVQNGGVGDSPPSLPSQESFYDCKDLYTHLFSPFSEAVDTLQAEGTLASLVIPAMCGIVQAICAVKEREEVKRFASVANTVIQGIDYGRCKSIREHDVFILATILDPRFKLTAFPDDCATIRLHDLPNRKEAIKILREAFDSVDYQQNAQPLVAIAPSTSNASILPKVDTSGAQDLANKKIFSFYMDRPIKKARQETEVEAYLTEDANPTYNPLSYWKLRESRWPRLAMVAKKVLPIPTGQGSPNRLFTMAKDFRNAQKWQIDLETMENMILYREHVT